MTHISYRICTSQDQPEIAQFLWSIRDDLLLTKESAAAEITQLIFDKGGAAAAYHNGSIVAMMGYFLGEPSQNYVNKDVGFIYITGIAKEHRLSRLFVNGMNYTFRYLQRSGIKEIRCHASVHDSYTNRLYSHFANRIGEDYTLRGRPAILYGAPMDAVIAYLDKLQARADRDAKRRAAPTIEPAVGTPTAVPSLATTAVPLSAQTAEPLNGTLWHCSPCNVWWLSRASSSPENWRLERMPEVDLSPSIRQSSTVIPESPNAPAWNVSGPSPLFCPECGKGMQTQTLEGVRANQT